MSGGWTDWRALTLALTFTAACILLAWHRSGEALDAAQHDLELDDLWLDGDEWIEPA